MLTKMMLALALCGQVNNEQMYVIDQAGNLGRIGIGDLEATFIGDSGYRPDGLARSPSGDLYLLSGTQLRRFDRNEMSEIVATSQLIADDLDFDIPNPLFDGVASAFAIDSTGLGIVGTDDPLGFSSVFTMNISNGNLNLLSTIGGRVYQDIAIDPTGRAMAVACQTSGLFAECSDAKSDVLIEINTRTGTTTEIGNLGVNGITSLANLQNSLIGMSGTGDLYRVDTVTGRADLIGASSPTVFASDSTATGFSAPPRSMRLESLLPTLNPLAENLVITTHGYSPVGTGPEWGDEFAAAIESRVGPETQVVFLDWSEESSGPLDVINQINNEGMTRGYVEGWHVVQHALEHGNLKSVTGIAHSAGAGLVDKLLEEVSRADISTEFIGLDMYTPNHSHSHDYGLRTDYAVSYTTDDVETGRLTGSRLANFHRVDLDDLEPLFCPNFSCHYWVHEWFKDTEIPSFEDSRYGIGMLGVVAGEFPAENRGADNGLVSIPFAGEVPRSIPLATLITEIDALNLEALVSEPKPFVTIEGETALLVADPGQSTVANFEIEGPLNYNYLKVTIDFLGNSEGYFTFNLDDESFGIDERFADHDEVIPVDDSRTYLFPLVDQVTTSRQLSLTLTGHGNAVSLVEISDIILGQAIVQEAVAGDANRDGFFRTDDLVQVFQRGEFEDDISLNSVWGDGDFNLDREFGTGDLVVAFQAGAYEHKPMIVWLVPETSSFALGLIGLLFLRRR